MDEWDDLIDHYEDLIEKHRILELRYENREKRLVALREYIKENYDESINKYTVMDLIERLYEGRAFAD